MLLPTCGWIFSFSQEAGSRTASLKRSNQVKGLRHSRSVSCSMRLFNIFESTLPLPSADMDVSQILFLLTGNYSSIHAMSQSTAGILMTSCPPRECSFWLWLLRCSSSDIETTPMLVHCIVNLGCPGGGGPVSPFRAHTECMLPAERHYKLPWRDTAHVGMWRASLTFCGKSRLRSPRILFKMEISLEYSPSIFGNMTH